MKLNFKIKKSTDFIFDYLTDMQKYVTVHPVITKISAKSDGSYLIYETLKVAFIPISFTYTATVESRPLEHIVIMRATVMQLTKIEMTFILESAGDWTTIEETISIKSPLPFKSIILNIFKEQHNQLFKNMSEVNHTP